MAVAPAIDTGAATLQRCLEATPAVDAAFTALEKDLAAKTAIDRPRIDALWSCIESVAASTVSIDDTLIARIHEDARLVRDASYGPRATQLLARVTPTGMTSTIATRLVAFSIKTAVHLVSDLQYEAAIPNLLALLEKPAPFDELARDVRYALLRMPRATEKYVIPALQAEPKQPPRPPPSNDPNGDGPLPPTLSVKEEIFLQILGDSPRPAARDAILARLKGETDNPRRTAITELAAANGVDDARIRTALIDAIMTTPGNTWGVSSTRAFSATRTSLILLTHHQHDPIIIDALMKFVSTFGSSAKKEGADDIGQAVFSICEAAPRAKMAAAAALARSAAKRERGPGARRYQCPTPEVDKILDRCREDAKCYATVVGETKHPTSTSAARRAALHGDGSTLHALVSIAATNDDIGTLYSIEEAVASLATKLTGTEAAAAAAHIEEVLAKRGFRATTGVRYEERAWTMPLFMTAARLRARSLPP